MSDSQIPTAHHIAVICHNHDVNEIISDLLLRATDSEIPRVIHTYRDYQELLDDDSAAPGHLVLCNIVDGGADEFKSLERACLKAKIPLLIWGGASALAKIPSTWDYCLRLESPFDPQELLDAVEHLLSYEP